MSVNERLKQYLEEHGIKQKFLVDKTRICDRTISDMVNKKRKITAEELGKIADALGVSADIFLR